MFTPYHTFTNCDKFLNTFNDLNSRQKVTPIAVERIPRYCISVVSKLHNSKSILDDILSTKKWDPSKILTASPSTMPSGSSLSPSNATVPTTPILDYQTIKLSNDFDNFFGSLFSSFDILAQVVNLVCLSRPLRNSQVSFRRMIDELSSFTAFRNHILTNSLRRIKNSRWYKDITSFRKVAIHRWSTMFRIQTEFEAWQLPAQEIKAIILCDDPESDRRTYGKNRYVGIFCAGLLTEALKAVDLAYDLMESEIRTADQIPI